MHNFPTCKNLFYLFLSYKDLGIGCMKKVHIKNPNFPLNKQHFERIHQVSTNLPFAKKVFLDSLSS